jgi:hypothetical protein
MEFDNLSRQVIGCAIEVHKTGESRLLINFKTSKNINTPSTNGAILLR